MTCVVPHSLLSYRPSIVFHPCLPPVYPSHAISISSCVLFLSFIVLFFFFFSSRRRHTRLVSDWSSDVCSSDLNRAQLGSSRTNPFFLLLPSWARFPMVVLATAATVIASQAVISGAFSVSRQAQIGRASCRERGYAAGGSVRWRGEGQCSTSSQR